MKLTINREFLGRHLFALVVLAGMGCWFGYDGYVKYPSKTPMELYAEAHNGEQAKDEAVARKFYDEAVPRQKEFMALCLVAATLVGLHLLAIVRTKVEFDDDGFTWNGRRYAYGDVKATDRSKWSKKGIAVVELKDGRKLKLDSWHHMGVDMMMQKMI